MKLLRIIPLSCLFLFSFAIYLQAQPQGLPITLGQSFSIQSEILDEDRPYMVYLPEDYDHTGDPVAVMYLMDGSGHFLHTSGIVDFLIHQNRIPEMMIVAIPNTNDRTRDLTPPIELHEASRQRMPTAGGANKTLAFMKDELMPHIEANYNTNPFQMLVGHSFGGIFVVNCLLTQPELFDAYISISPSLWWDQQHLITKTELFLEENPDLKGYFYMTMGNERKEMLGSAMKMAAVLEMKAPDSFAWDFKIMEEETHGSIPHRSTYDGLEAIFKDWYSVRIGELYQEGGMEALKTYLAGVEEKMGYRKKLSESSLNRFGYQLMRNNQLGKALEIFQLNAQQYPSSFNVFDSMGEAYMKMGNQEQAISNYKKSLDLHPGNQNAVMMLQEMGETYDPTTTQIKLSTKKMKQYVGEYSAIRGMTLHISLEGGELMAWADPMITKQKLLAFPDNRFMLSEMNILLEFSYNDQEEVIGYVAQMGIGQTASGEKLK
ncbi:MAG: alpha/beta hydrolase-fold protein [Bacteroidota bacterium]